MLSEDKNICHTIEHSTQSNIIVHMH
jgi:hypothetical protein